LLALKSGYVARGKAIMPQQGATWPWRYNVDYMQDLWTLRFARLDDGAMHFEALQDATVGSRSMARHS
jgi:hypothetical protein